MISNEVYRASLSGLSHSEWQDLLKFSAYMQYIYSAPEIYRTGQAFIDATRWYWQNEDLYKLGIVSGGGAGNDNVNRNENKGKSDVNITKGAEGKLPNLENAQIDPNKIKGYALDPNHPVGGNKAKVFDSALGYNQSNAEQLISQVRQQLPNSKAVLGLKDQYGQRFTVDMLITGSNGNTATVRTGWIFDVGSDIPRLTTIFVK